MTTSMFDQSRCFLALSWIVSILCVTFTHAQTPVSIPFRLNAGGKSFTDTQGRTWAGADFTGGVGNSYATGDSITIAEDYDKELYQSELWNPSPVMEFSIPVDNGDYFVRLHFAEIFHSSVGTRVFDISIEDKPVLTNFDILSHVPHDTAYIVDQNVTVSDNMLNVALSHVLENPKISGIEILLPETGSPATMTTAPTMSPSVSASTGPLVTGFSLVEAKKTSPAADIRSLSDGDTIFLGDLPAINIVAKTTGKGIGSVQFKIDGHIVHTEGAAPYALGGDVGGKFFVWTAPMGVHTLEATIFDQANGTGSALHSLLVTLNFVEKASVTAQPSLQPSISPSDAPVFEPKYINCGGQPFQDNQNRLWIGDATYDVNKRSKTYSTGDTISATGEYDQRVYKSERWDPADSTELSYAIAAPNGEYLVRLHFAEIFHPSSNVGVRVFDVVVEGKIALDDFDILAEVPHDTALVKETTTTVSDGTLNIELIHELENPKVSGIEVHLLTGNQGSVSRMPSQRPSAVPSSFPTSLPTGAKSSAPSTEASIAPSGIMSSAPSMDISASPSIDPSSEPSAARPEAPSSQPSIRPSSTIDSSNPAPEPLPTIFINAGGQNYTDPAGNLWVADSVYNFHSGVGNAFTSGVKIVGTNMERLYQSERWDPSGGPELEYKIPVPNGDYLVSLHFAEIFMSSPGQRVFDVAIEEQLVFYDFDIVREVGKGAPLVKESSVSVTDGELNILFKHWTDNPKISGIRVGPMPVVPSLVDKPNGCGIETCGMCEGGCSSNEECSGDLLCFHRQALEDVDGCSGEGTSGMGYCYQPKYPQLQLSNDCSVDNRCGVCEGDCNYNSQCAEGLICAQRSSNDDPVHGCSGDPVSNYDYCIDATPDLMTLTLYQRRCSYRDCLRCEGHCRGDHECGPGLKCYPREGLEPIPGCKGSGLFGVSYCFEAPEEETTIPNALALADTACSETSPCDVCEGSCETDSDCKAGLSCKIRSANEAVPGCVRGQIGDIEGTNYCYEAPTAPVTYFPGELQPVNADGLSLSLGLSARIVAIEGDLVQYSNGGQSAVPFHKNPDAGATFLKADGGWIYVSNSEADPGGVGALHFDQNGQVTGYEMITTSTNWNCGGGKTWWNTWVTCKETYAGQVWEVDPWGSTAARTTSLGGSDGGYFESVAYDRSDPANPSFYVTEDSGDGALRRFTPDAAAVVAANESDDYSNLLYSNETGTAKLEYLLIHPDPQNPNQGTFSWTDESNRSEARKDAATYYSFSEGIDIRNGIVYMTAKKPKVLMILDLQQQTYHRSSTESGAFEGEPDQIQRIIGDGLDDSILYFCEDSPRDNAGVHGRDSQGNFYSILAGTDLRGETTGLAFSPDYKHMYLSYQVEGIIFDITRDDGYPFGGQRLDIKYHAPDNKDEEESGDV